MAYQLLQKMEEPMRHLFRCTLAIGLLLIITACAGPKIEQDYKPGTEFDSGWTYYEFRGGSSQIEGADYRRLETIAQEILAGQGYQLAPHEPQFYIDITGSTRLATGGGKSLGISIGLPVGSHGSVGVGGSKNLDGEGRQEGVIIVDITNAQTNELIWRGSASGIPLEDFQLAREAQLREVMRKLLAQFPPEK